MNDSTKNTDSKQTQGQTTNSTGYVDPNVKVDDPAPTTITNEIKKDDYGYEIPQSDEEKKAEADKIAAEEKAAADKKIEDEKVKDPSTGYGKDDKTDPVKKPDELTDEQKKALEDGKTEEVKLEEQRVKDINDSLGELSDSDKKLISEFAITNKMTKEQTSAYAELIKSENTKAVELQAQRDQEIRSGWMTELKSDPEFGGENFDLNVDKAEKVLEKYLPNLKKALTERGNMMPPYIMRDLLSLSKTLNPTTDLVGGDPSKPVKKEEGNFLDDLYK